MLSLKFQEVNLAHGARWRSADKNDMRRLGVTKVGIQVQYGTQKLRTRFMKLQTTSSGNQVRCIRVARISGIISPIYDW